MTNEPSPDFVVAWLSDAALELAFHKADGLPSPSDSPALAELRTAGVIDWLDELTPVWGAALRYLASCPTPLAIRSVYNDHELAGAVTVGDDLTVSVLRQAISERPQRPRLIASRPNEICITAGGGEAALAYRMLPPVEVFRAPEAVTFEQDVMAEPLAESHEAAASFAMGQMSLGAALSNTGRQVAGSTTMVQLIATSAVPAAAAGAATYHEMNQFVTDETNLWQVGLADGIPVITSVQTGAVAYAIRWLIEGQLTRRGELEGAGA